MTPLSVSLHEWETRHPEPGSTLANASLEGDDVARNLASELTSAGQIEILELANGLELRATSFVGHFLLGHISVTIRPKIPGRRLLNLLRYAYGLRHLQLLSPLKHATSDCSFQDLLIHQLNTEVAELLSRGLHRDYRRRSEELPIPRGRLDFKRYAGTASRATALLPCVHYPRLEDNLINQVLLAGLGFACHLTSDIELRTALRRSAQMIGLAVSVRPLDHETILEAFQALDRRTEAYRPALKLIELLKKAKGITLQRGARTLLLPGFLFDMNRFFQAVLSRFLRENLPAHSVNDEPRLRGMFVYDAAHNPLGLRAPVQKPDFVVMKGSAVVGVIDAKYRDLWKHALTRDILYQLALYALGPAGHLRRSIILYPTLETAATEQVIIVQDPINSRSRAYIAVRPVNLDVLDEVLSPPSTESKRRKRLEMANHLALSPTTQAGANEATA